MQPKHGSRIEDIFIIIYFIEHSQRCKSNLNTWRPLSFMECPEGNGGWSLTILQGISNDNITVDRKKMSVMGSISVIFFITRSDIPARIFFTNINIRPMNGTFLQKLFFLCGKLSSDSTSGPSLMEFFNISSDSIIGKTFCYFFLSTKCKLSKPRRRLNVTVRFLFLSTTLKTYS